MQQQIAQICGLDEAGRGPLAGPVVAACVVLRADFPVHLLNDSKKLSEKKRSVLEALIKEEALAYAVGLASAQEIDRLNILRASMLAMQRAYDKVKQTIPISLRSSTATRPPTSTAPSRRSSKAMPPSPPSWPLRSWQNNIVIGSCASATKNGRSMASTGTRGTPHWSIEDSASPMDFHQSTAEASPSSKASSSSGSA